MTSFLREVARHDFKAREFAFLLVFAQQAVGGEVPDRKVFDREGWGLDNGHALEVIRELVRDRVLKELPWRKEGRLVIEGNVDLWKRRARERVAEQAAVVMESGDDGVRFHQELSKIDLARASETAAGVLPAPADSRVCCPELGNERTKTGFPQFGEKPKGGPPDGGLAVLPNLGTAPHVHVDVMSCSLSELLGRVENSIGPAKWARWDTWWRERAIDSEIKLRRAVKLVEDCVAGGWKGNSGGFLLNAFKRFMNAPSLEEAVALCPVAGIDPEVAKTWWYDRDSSNWRKHGEQLANWKSDLIAFARKWAANSHERELRYQKGRNENNRSTRNNNHANSYFAPGAEQRSKAKWNAIRKTAAADQTPT